MHFDDGDNEIPVTVEDYHGNKREYNVVVRAEFVRSDAPQIDIDNNIDIYIITLYTLFIILHVL